MASVKELPELHLRQEKGQQQRAKEEYINRRLKSFFDRYEWWFVLFGLFGNLLFLIGSICFLSDAIQTFAISLFIAGSGIMLVSSAAASLAEYSRSKLK
jgi:hypothetical protein